MAKVVFKDIPYRRWVSERRLDSALVVSKQYEALVEKLGAMVANGASIVAEHHIVRPKPSNGDAYDVVDITVEFIR